ncbi:DUF4189 domain-containing protein [Cochlodiniinecator piscidefendens]|uniref:DUF4189 domain-containing protein n=1 Tax=Cochlodiniinecator piscidefendens TaxID=2715756 RepID=UPI00140B79A3|nr:DUF4189 domain-containing protein [Cochlodiniinecator piscidefendens]
MQKLLIGAMVLGLNAGVGHAQQVQVYTQAHTVQIHSGVRLHPTTQQEFDQQFRKSNYFGAFVISANGAYGWSKGYLTEDAAVYQATQTCENYRQPHEAECTLYATLIPVGYQDMAGQTLSYEATEDFFEIRDTTEGAAAFVVSDAGVWGWSSGYDTEFEAISGAFNSCVDEAALDAELDTVQFPCHLVWTRP